VKKILLLVSFLILFNVSKAHATVIFSDDFNRSDSTNLGSNWTEVYSTPSAGLAGIRTNMFRDYPYVGRVNLKLEAHDNFSLGVPDYSVSATSIIHTYNMWLGLVGPFCREQGTELSSGLRHGYYLNINVTSQNKAQLGIGVYNGLTSGQVGSSYTSSVMENGSIHNYKLLCSGNLIQAYMDGALVISGTHSLYTNEGYHGLWVQHGAVENGKYDYFGLDNYVLEATISGSINTSPSTNNVTVGAPFDVDIVANSNPLPFNAVKSTVSVSSNLAIANVKPASSNSCNMQYSQTPSASDPSFAGAIYNASSSACTVYTLTLLPTATGTGTVTFSNQSIKAYSSAKEIFSDSQNGSYTINNPSIPVPELTINSYFPNTYGDIATVSGTKYDTITEVDINDSTSGVNLPTSTTWNSVRSLVAGTNTFTLYGKDSNNNQTASQTITINRRTLGDINGDGTVTIADASLFAIDWGKTSNLIYNLSDMNNDGSANLTDLSILAKLITP